MFLALRVLPGEICKRLNAECNLPERGKEQSGARSVAHGHLGYQQGRGAAALAACGERVAAEIPERR
jgi:hypothetical protein